MAALPQTIEVDPKVLENDDENYLSAGYASDTTSLSSAVNEYIFENGRRYHSYYGPDKNLHPTDETEQDRLDIHHEILLLITGHHLHEAPLDNPQRILDIGTGTGLWAIDMADKYPSAEVIGTDLSPIQPKWVPPNCRFEVDDAEQPFTFMENSFDYIHVRNLAQGISDWKKFMTRVYRCTKPGGYVELGELDFVFCSDDNTMPANHGGVKYFEALSKAMIKIGRPPPESRTMLKYMQDAGFTDIKVLRFKHILGPWPKEKHLKQAGAMALLSSETGFHAYGMAAFTRILEMEKEEAEKLCLDALRAVRNKNYHVYSHYHVVYGQKPEICA